MLTPIMDFGLVGQAEAVKILAYNYLTEEKVEVT